MLILVTAYLAHFPIDKVNVDQSFVRNIPDDRASPEITATIIALAKTLNLQVVAEVMETDALRGAQGRRHEGVRSVFGEEADRALPGSWVALANAHG